MVDETRRHAAPAAVGSKAGKALLPTKSARLLSKAMAGRLPGGGDSQY